MAVIMDDHFQSQKQLVPQVIYHVYDDDFSLFGMQRCGPMVLLDAFSYPGMKTPCHHAILFCPLGVPPPPTSENWECYKL